MVHTQYSVGLKCRLHKFDLLASNIFFGYTPRVLSPFRGGGIAYLNDLDSYAGWSLYTPVGATQARQVEG